MFEQEQKKKMLDVYITDVVRMIAENTAKQGGGVYIKKRYIDFVDGKQIEQKPPAQILDDLLKSGAIKIKEKEE